MISAMYVHVPFCENICAYCDFGRCKMHASLAERWLLAVERELKVREIDDELETIYIGGGTPSALSVDQLDKLLSLLDEYTKGIKEYTIEVNPENICIEKLTVMKKHGVNRISLGVQSFNDELVKRIERHHNKARINEVLDMIHEIGIHNISIDLMYGLPDQSLKQLADDVEIAASDSRISHISIYSLTIEEHSKFGRQGIEPCDNELEGLMYELICDMLPKYGYEHYEISNFAKSGFESKHNQMYWQYADYAGIGCGASGKENHIRYDRPFQLQDYLNDQEKCELIKLNKSDEMFEMIMMGLRMKKGIDLNHFEELFGCSLLSIFASAVNENIDRGWLVLTKDRLYPSIQGMTFLNDLLLAFMD